MIEKSEMGKHSARVKPGMALIIGLVGMVIGGLITFNQVASHKPAQMQTVGETAVIALPDVGLSYLSRIDTGARVTSLHVVDYEISGEPLQEGERKSEHIGRNIRFVTVNEYNQSASYETKVLDVSSVRNAQGTEDRYVVELALEWQGVTKKVKVNLRDRSAMSYKLLIGRNWLDGDFVVDVSQSEGVIQ
ncbi:MAG: RimK/LysX family protein [Candidatus Pelagadaptatus aseana]